MTLTQVLVRVIINRIKKDTKMTNEHKILNWALGIGICIVLLGAVFGIIDWKKKHADIALSFQPSTSKVVPEKPKEPVYSLATPAYDYMTLTKGAEPITTLDNGQKVVVIGVNVLSLWLENAINKTIVSIASFDRGPQGSTSSFVIVYTEK